ncbi:conjugative transfer protein MobI(A/C) [Thalassolituus marinus]|uniref:Uncharacterized protein n=1 Tax=Thalassolituus marinus TaxID=671053 RepID=A0ABS7ZUK1_9GAMM|nr:conjugative transfer protein MobI(A/C) [Thalassolituus marinus]MCA6065441.1 hypothetical protein [Thalassolituus marinus]
MKLIPNDDVYQALDSCQAHSHSSSSEVEIAIAGIIEAANSVAGNYCDKFLELQQAGPGKGSRWPSVRARDGVGGKTLEIRWVRSLIGPEGRVRYTVPKGSGHAYNVNKLCKGSPDWERELVEEAESLFSLLRELYSQLSKCRQDLKRLDQIKKKIEETLAA